MEEAALRGDAVAYYLANQAHAGESPGKWAGRAAKMFGFKAGDTATIKQVRLLLGEMCNPVTGEQLGKPPKRYLSSAERMAERLKAEPNASAARRHALLREVSAAQQTARGFYDATFSAPKSVSLLHASLKALGEAEQAEAVLEAHRAGIDAAMRYAGEHACWVRRGSHKSVAGQSVGKFEQARGFAEIRFDHAMSRAEDPQMHTHVAISNKVLADDGTWLAVHAAVFQQAKAMMDAVYTSVMEERIAASTGVRFEVRPDGRGREVAGFRESDLLEYSKRRQQVISQEAARVAKFEQEMGREPSAEELKKINYVAGRENRARKTGRGAEEQFDRWAETADVERYRRQWQEAARVIDIRRASERGKQPSRHELVRSALADLQAERATWTRGELVAKLTARMDEIGGDDHELRMQLATTWADEALARGNEFDTVDLSRPDVIPVPGWWHDSRGVAEWRDPAAGCYTTADQLSVEQALCADARRTGARALTAEALCVVEAELAAMPRPLSPDQRNVVLGILGSDRAGDVLVAPAGSGKSYTTGTVLTRQWQQHHGGRVIGVATSQKATDVLIDEGLTGSLNASRFLLAYDPSEHSSGPSEQLTDRDLVVVDEANMSSTGELHRILTVAGRSGAKVIFQGDPQQLSAVGAGGGLALMNSENGGFTLDRVHRFEAEWEREASLRLRDGDLSAIDAYEDHGRIQSGTREDIRRAATRNYVADLQRGRSSVLVVRSNDEASEVSRSVQHLLMAIGKVGGAVLGGLRDGNLLRPGDVLQARHNDYSLGGGGVTNREVLQAVDQLPNGAVRCRRMDGETDEFVELPVDYVREHVTLGYAGTEHAVEGMTTDTAHALHPGYVALTRGRASNTMYLETQRQGSEEEKRLDLTPREVLAGVFSREAGQESAVAEWRKQVAASRDLGGVLQVFDIVGAEIARDRHNEMLLNHVGRDQTDRISMESDAGQNGLFTAMRRAETAGYDVDAVLHAAVTSHHFGGVHELSRVLRSRFTRELDHHEPQVKSSWSERAETEGGIFAEYHRELGGVIDARSRELGEACAQQMPEWAERSLGQPPEQGEQRDEWIKRAGRVAAYREAYRVPEHAVSIGAQPNADAILQRAAFADAARAMLRPTDALDYTTRTDLELQAQVSRWEREQLWAPAYVAVEQGKAYEAARTYEAEAILQRSQAETVTDPEVAEQLRQAADEAERIGARMAHRAEVLEEAAGTWRDWQAATEAQRDAAEQAAIELDRRGRAAETPQPAAEAEQTSLFEVTTEFEPALAEGTEQQPSLFADSGAQRSEREERDTELEVEVDPAQEQLFEVQASPAQDAAREGAQIELGELAAQPAPARSIEGDNPQVSTIAEVVRKAEIARDRLASQQAATQARAAEEAARAERGRQADEQLDRQAEQEAHRSL